MKRLAIGLSILILLAMLSPCFSILAQPSHTPHQKPATAKSSLDPVSLLRFYGSVSELIATRRYQDAQTMLNRIKYANIPDELRYIINLYSSLSQQLVTTLNNLEYLLDETSTLFARNQTSDARQRLNEAESTIYSAQFLLEDIEAVTDTLGEELGVFTALAGSEIRLVYERQQQNLYQIRQLINELNQLRESLGLNPLMAIRTSFYHPTFLEVSAPETAYPGLPITISGEVSSKDGNVDRTVKVFLDNIQLAEETIQGQFSLQVTPPQQISTGRHILTVAATPEGRYAGALRSLLINIEILIWTEIYVPSLITIPETIRISGKVHRGLSPLQDAKVNLRFRDSLITVKTATDGSFTATIDAPFDLSLVGPRGLIITIEPVEPEYTPLEIKRWILIVNPAYAGLILVAFISLGLLVYKRARTSPLSRREEMVTPEVKPGEPPTIVRLPRAEYEFTGIKGRILSAYLNGLEAVEKVTSIPMAPHITLREFLNTATPWLPAAIKPFAELTLVAEIALYSAYKLDEDMATKAEQLATIIKEELHEVIY